MSTTAAPQRTGARSSDLQPPSRLAGEYTGAQPHPLLALQRAFGNQLVQRHLLGGAVQLQPEMEVTRPDDEYEREADRVADNVMRLPDTAVARQVAEHEKKKEEPPKPPVPKPPEVKPAAPPPKPPEVKKELPKTTKPEEKKKEEPPKVARKGAAAAAPQQVSEPVATSIRAQQGGGRPLAASERSFFEPRIGRDLGGVRIHDDPVAARSASDLGARAFTHGRDVFFAQGRYQPGTEAGRRLLAHELTHTIQQKGDQLGRVVQRANGASPTSPSPAAAAPSTASATPAATAGTAPGGGLGNAATGVVYKSATPKRIELPSVDIPSWKMQPPYGQTLAGQNPYATSPHELLRWAPYRRGKPYQRRVWPQQIITTESETALSHLVSSGGAAAAGAGGGTSPPQYTFRAPPQRSGGPPRLETGTVADVAKALSLPTWGKNSGTYMDYEVDHLRELQTANWPQEDWANNKDNFALLEASINGSSGGTILGQIETSVRRFVAQADIPALVEAGVIHQPGGSGATPAAPPAGTPALAAGTPAPTPGPGGATPTRPYATEDTVPRNVARSILNNWQIKWIAANPLSQAAPGRDDYWKVAEVEHAEHLDRHVHVANPADFGAPGTLFVFPRPGSGEGHAFNAPTDTVTNPDTRGWLKPWTITTASFNTGGGAATGGAAPTVSQGQQLGTLALYVPTDHPQWEPQNRWELNVLRGPGQYTTGYIDQNQILAHALLLRAKGLSPIHVDDLSVPGAEGVLIHGTILPDVEPLRNNAPQFELHGNELRVYQEFSTGALNVPPPFTISDSSIVLFASTTQGLGIQGSVDFGIDKVGEGSLSAQISTSAGFSFDGNFVFDRRLFDHAEVQIGYRERQWWGRGTIGIPEGKVPGIKSATVTVGYSAGNLDATGTAELSIPGVKQGSMHLHYSEAEGLAIGGVFDLADNIPGIRSGHVEAMVRERRDHSGYAVTATGTAQPAIPGVDSTLTIAYDDGAFTISGHAAYARGIVSGSIDLGATNRPVDPDGNPIPNAPPGDTLTAYGRGQATVRLTPWLQGTVGIQLRPNGEIVLSGEIGLPDTVDVFPAKNYTRNIVTIGLDIPIIGVAAFGQRIGIFATIQGGLDFDAGVGPGQLQQLRLGITYEPAHEERTHITGDGLFVIPAHAGLRLFIRGGAGAGIPVVSATVGIEVGGALGLEGAAQAGVHIDWTPGRGLVLDARGEIYVEPKFRFDVSLFALVEASAFGLHYEFYNRRWVLAAIEYGSGLRLGIAFPIHYEEGRPFELDWNQVQFQIPDVNPREVLTGLIERITGE